MKRVALFLILLVATTEAGLADCNDQAALAKCTEATLKEENIAIGGYISNVGEKRTKAQQQCQATCGLNPSRFQAKYGASLPQPAGSPQQRNNEPSAR